MRADPVTDPICYHAEGPVWWPSWGLRWVDMLAGDVMTLRPDGEPTRTHVGTVVACLRPREGGGAVLALERAVASTRRDDLTELTVGPTFVPDGIRLNEGGCDPDGRFWVGSMAYDQQPDAATLYVMDEELSAHVALDPVTVSNGIVWSPDGATGYYADTATHQVISFPYDGTAAIEAPRTLVDLGPDGSPDGLTVDAEGGVWMAMNGDGEVRRYTPQGRLDEVVQVPARQVTACTFGGDDLGTLYITTSREGLDDGDDPLAGGVCAIRPGVSGLPALTWRG